MEKYHIYEEIGKGEFSQVFKGREKKRIEYVAIKRIEKSVMNKIINEVNIMHRLNNAHMLKFHDWYETKNNLWLILEYCTGGNLESILLQDGHLPEHAIRIFGLDILAALKYLHSIGYIHGDLRPKNFLIDEYGILKLTDFKFTVKIPKDRLEDRAIESRGFPPYMAPELFTSDGVHSFQSDFWALGCVLYELRRGQPPFGGSSVSLDRLMNNIRTIEPIHSPIAFSSPNRDKNKSNGNNNTLPTISAELADLLLWLLEKAPMNRCTWRDLSLHPFWKPSNVSAPTELPVQPAFDKLVRELEKARSEQLEQASNAEYNLSMDDIQAYNNSLQNQSMQTINPSIQDTPIKKMLPPVDFTPMRPEGAKSSHRNNKNSQNQENNAIGEEIIELQTERINNHKPESETPREKPPTPLNKTIDIPVKEIETNAKQSSAVPSSIVGMTTPQTVAKTPGGVIADATLNLLSPDTLLMHASDTQVKPIVGNKQIETIERIDYLETTLPFESLRNEQISRLSQTDLEVHLTQVYKALNRTVVNAQSNAVTAQVANALTDRVNILGYICSIASSAEVANVVLNTHFLALILKLLKANPTFTSTNPRINNSPSQSNLGANASNISSLSQQSRYLSATVLAVMLRYTTFIQPPSIRARDEHIVATLVSLLKDGNRSGDHKLRKRVTAAFGEIVFYITAQEDDGSGSVIDANGETPDRWVLPPVTVDLFLKCLKDDSDEIVKHYAAKTIENVLAQGGIAYRKKFSIIEIGQALLEVSQTNRNEILQGTAGMAVVHMVYLVLNAPFTASQELSISKDSPLNEKGTKSKKASSNNPTTPNNPNFQDVFQHPSLTLSGKFIVKLFEKVNFMTFLEILKDGQLKLQQSYLNLLNAILVFPFGCNSIQSIPLIELIDYASNSGQSNSSSSTPGKTESTNATTITSILYSNVQYQQFIQDGIERMGILSCSALLSSFQLISSIRNFFLKSSNTTVVPILLKLVEQSSINIIRAKALLSYQLLCYHVPKVLLYLPERRFASMMIRIIEPILTHPENTITNVTSSSKPTNNNASVNKDNNSNIQSNYLLKNTLSFILFLKQSCNRSVRMIQLLLTELSTLPLESISAVNGGHNNLNGINGNSVLYGTPAHGGMNLSDRSPAVNYNTKSPGSPLRQNNNKANINSLKSPLSQQQQQKIKLLNQDKILILCRQVKQYADLLRAIISVISPPALCRLLLAGNEIFLLELGQALKVLPTVRVMLVSSSSNLSSKNGSMNEVLDAIVAAEQACLASLECVSQVEIPESLDLQDLIGQQFHERQQQTPNLDPNHPNVLLSPFQPNWILFIAAMFLHIFPCVSKLLTHSEGDVRVLVAAFFRKTLPIYHRLYCQFCITDRVIPFPNERGVHVETAIKQATARNALKYQENGYHQNDGLLAELLQMIHPANITSTISFFNNPKVINDTLIGIFQVISSLLTDQPPIPQYMIRLFNELIELLVQLFRSEYHHHHSNQKSAPQPPSSSSIRFTVVSSILQEMVQTMKTSGSINILIHLLKTSGSQLQQQMQQQQQRLQLNASNDEENNQPFVAGLDTQLILLLRNLFEWNKESAALLLESDVASSLSIALIATVYANIQYPFIHPILQQKDSNHTSTAISFDSSLEVLVPLIDLIHLVLHYVLREISAVASAMNQTQTTPASTTSAVSSAVNQQYQLAEQHKRLIASLKSITPALLLLIVYIESYIDETSSYFDERMDDSFFSPQDQQNHLIKLHLLETSTRCLGILFDLFSETITNQLLSKHSVVLDHQLADNPNKGPLSSPSMYQGSSANSGALSLNPRMICSRVIRNHKIEQKVVLKMMKILFGLVKVSINLNAVTKIKEFISSDVIQQAFYHALHYIQEREQSQQVNRAGGNELTPELVNIGKIAQQILEIGKTLH